MKLLNLLAIAIALILVQGCATGMSSAQQIKFSSNTGELTFVTSGCYLTNGKFTDRSGNGNRFPHFKFIAVDDSGNTKAEFYARCSAVAGNGTSDCRISPDQVAQALFGGWGCPNLGRFKLFN